MLFGNCSLFFKETQIKKFDITNFQYMFEQYKLKNKINVILKPQRDTQSTTFLVMYPVGSRYESQKMSGVSHYVEHLMFKGTEKRKNTLTLTREIDRLGAEYNAFTGKEYTAYYIKVDVQYTQVALDILSDMLFHSKFDPKEMEKEKPVIVEELRMYRDNPLMNIENVFEENLYQGALGRDIGGTDKHVMGFDRKDVLAFRDKYYHPKAMTVVVAGKIHDDLKNFIAQYFENTSASKPIASHYEVGSFGSAKKQDRLKVQYKKTDQSQLMIGFPGFSHTDEKNYAGSVLNTIFGGSMSSRLFIQVRERRGLAYMVRSGSENYRDTGYFFIRAGLENKNINKALGVMQQEIEKLIKKGVTKRELADAKTHIRGSVTLSFEDSSTQANWYARQALFQSQIETPEQELKRIEAVTAEEIQSLAKEVFDWNKVRIAVIGDIDEKNIHF